MKCYAEEVTLTLFRIGLSGAAHGWKWEITPYLKSVEHTPPLEFCLHQHFSPEISNFCYIGK